MAFHIALIEPLIPQNTGNIGRLCVATNSTLHLIEPLGFDISSSAVRRAGLDYWKHLNLKTYPSFAAFKEKIPSHTNLWFISKFGKKTIYDASFSKNDFLIFGKETKGLPSAVHETEPQEAFLKIPLLSKNARSLNLGNAASIVLYEALRQTLKDWEINA